MPRDIIYHATRCLACGKDRPLVGPRFVVLARSQHIGHVCCECNRKSWREIERRIVARVKRSEGTA